MLRILLVVLVGAAAVLALVLWQAGRRWRAATVALVERLEAGARAAPGTAAAAAPAPFSAADLEGLPAPVARGLRRVLPEGQPLPRRVRITWRGTFNLGRPGKDAWRPFTATQVFAPGAPGFVWDARVAMAPGLTVFVRDGFVGGQGSMHASLCGVVTLVDAHDTPTLASGALQRYLGEACWFPAALLARAGVRWAALDDSSARATLAAGGTTAALDFHFGADGTIASVYAAGRFYDDGKTPPRLLPWQARNLRFEERAGVTVPADATVEWLFPEGPFAYWRGQPVAIDYE
jgi:hypothetical protein